MSKASAPLLASTILLISPFVFGQTWKLHTFKKGETLTTMLQAYSLRPIYGHDGSWKKTVKLNPELARDSGNKISIGQKVKFPVLIEAPIEPTPIEPTPVVVLKPLERVPSIDPTDDATAGLSASAGVDFFEIKGTDESSKDSASILSEASPSVILGYNLNWDSSTTYAANVRVVKYKLEELNNGQSFDKDSGQKVDFSFRVLKHVSEKWSVGGGAAFEQDLFFHSETAEKLNVDKLLITKPQLAARYVATAKRNTSLGIDGKLGFNFGKNTDDYKIKKGSNFGLGPFFRYHTPLQDKNYKSLEAKVFYGVDNQDTSETTRKVTNLSFLIQYEWALPW